VTKENVLNSALQLHRAGDLDAAAGMYRLAYEKNSNDANACYGLGTVLMQQGKPAEAVTLLKQAEQLGPEVPEFIFNHACVLGELGQRDDAVKGYLRAAKLVGTDAAMLTTICHKLVGAGLPDAALHFLSSVPQPDVPVLTLLATAKTARGDPGGAAVTLRQITDLEPGNAQAWYALALASGRIRDYAAAIDAYETYMQLKSPDANDELAYADLLFIARRPTEALKVLDKAMASGADSAAAHLLAAKCRRLEGDRDGTRSHLRQAIEKQAALGDAWQILLETEDEGSLPELANKCMLLAADEGNDLRDRVMLALTAGRALERLGQYSQAFQQFIVGNKLQEQDRESKELQFDNVSFDRLATRTREECDVPFAGASERNPERQPIFILGMPRSGSTLVERILGELDGVTQGGENEAMEFLTKQVWWDLEQGRAAHPRDFSSAEWDRLTVEYWRRTGLSPCRLTDKMPHNIWHVGFICAMFPGAPIIYMKRDPRDVCLSIYTRMFPDGHRYATSLHAVAQYYAISAQMMAHWKAIYPERILEFDYEELIADPEARTKELARFCCVDWRPECLDFHERVVASHTFSEMQVRQPLNDKGIGAWRRYESELEPLVEALQRSGVLSPDQ